MLKNLRYRLQQPPGIWTWRYLTQPTNAVVQQHWKALWYPTVKQSRMLSWAMVVVQQLAWWSFFGWRAFYWVWKSRAKREWMEGLPSLRQQLYDCWYAIFLYGIPPHHYFAYQLYRYPKKQWLDFVYRQEVPKWQQSLSGKVRADHQRYISSKKYFGKKSQQQGVPAVPTIRFVQKGQILKAEAIFQQRSLFFKPDQANQSRGCFSLIYQEDSDSYFLIKEKVQEGIESPTAILQELNKQFQQQDYLVQPLLLNHPDMTSLCGTERLTTMRIITVYVEGDIQLLSAILEVPKTDDRRYYHLVALDPTSGRLASEVQGQHLLKEPQKEIAWLQQREGKKVPYWQAIRLAVQQAHLLCADYRTIGWDVCLTPAGVRLIEGNAGWGIKVHQLANQGNQKRLAAELGFLKGQSNEELKRQILIVNETIEVSND